MRYFVDEGTNFQEADGYEEARAIALAAMESAAAVRNKLGRWPYWARQCEIRIGNARDLENDHGEARNRNIVSQTRPLIKWEKERAKFIRAFDA